MEEQKVEKMWFLSANKQVADKRRDEEMKQTLKEWSDARARIEIECQRKQEHQNSATKFESRAFRRSNWKTKNFDPKSNPLFDSTSSSSGEEDAVDITSPKRNA